MLRTIVWLSLVVLGVSCQRSAPKVHTVQAPDTRQQRELLVRANQALVRADSITIADSLAAWGWQATPMPSGLWLQVLQPGQGDSLRVGDVVRLSYELRLFLTQRLCYSSDSLGIKEIKLGQAPVEYGLDLGLRHLRSGSHARLILPPHLAHGLTGDGNQIGSRAILLYELRPQRVDEAHLKKP